MHFLIFSILLLVGCQAPFKLRREGPSHCVLYGQVLKCVTDVSVEYCRCVSPINDAPKNDAVD